MIATLGRWVRPLLGYLAAGFIVANAFLAVDTLASSYDLTGTAKSAFTFLWLFIAIFIGGRLRF